MIKLDLSNDDVQILIDLLETAVSELRMEIMQTDNREYRKMLQQREAILKRLHVELAGRLEQKMVEEVA
ncbi:MAG: hypothetical protein GYA12_01390 [Chloroflexi bacterium]|nr:hypothetical protein [Chloroflexota bacterium]BCY17650.1 hypothetical protein hrd7_14990 [Leptolinea sp. HRD-7]